MSHAVPQLVDSHCHIPMIEGMSHNEVVDNARNVGVGNMLCVSVDLEGLPEVLATAESDERIHASVGIHPNTQLEKELTVEELLDLASHDKVIAIGETGLDYFRSEGDLEWQRNRFRTHIEAAKACRKPIIIHTREAREDTLKILQEENASEVGGIMHCFVEDWESAEKAMAMNFLISFSGIVTFKNAKELQEVAQRVPLEKMLIETDSPYLAPVPMRGKQNQPAFVKHVAEFIADLKGVDYQDVVQQTSDNYFKLFNLN